MVKIPHKRRSFNSTLSDRAHNSVGIEFYRYFMYICKIIWKNKKMKDVNKRRNSKENNNIYLLTDHNVSFNRQNSIFND